MYHTEDTIAAIGTAAGGAARGMVRVSGPAALNIVSACFTAADGRPLDAYDRPTAIPGRVRSELPAGADLDCILYLWPNDRSYTRQPVAEVHTIGSPPLLEAVLAALCRAGARLAEPGEFTLRAFLAGRIDLTQAEAVLGIIDARGKHELDAALTQLAGGLADPLAALRNDLLQLLAELEAGLDFVDEDIRFISAEETAARIAHARDRMADITHQLGTRQTIDRLHQVVLIGPPNAGKSSLFNALVARCGANRGDARRPSPALVSPHRGTTRDYLTASLSLNGVSCELVDTAGIGPDIESHAIDAAAQSAAAERRDRAPVRLWCVDATAHDSDAVRINNAGTFDPARDLFVLTKVDVAHALNVARFDWLANTRIIATSSRTGEGLDELAGAIRNRLQNVDGVSSNVVATTAERCRDSVRRAAESLARAAAIVADQAGDELVAAETRAALDELGRVVGAVYTDDLLDRVFSTFCIGK